MSPLTAVARPSGFISLRDLSEERVGINRFVNVIGIVKDCRLPIPTNGAGNFLVNSLVGRVTRLT
jgi:hypothetical protein